jgi:hypothetical protein
MFDYDQRYVLWADNTNCADHATPPSPRYKTAARLLESVRIQKRAPLYSSSPEIQTKARTMTTKLHQCSCITTEQRCKGLDEHFAEKCSTN